MEHSYLERAIKVPSVEAEVGVRLAQALVVKSSTDPDKAKKIESLQRAVDLLKRSKDLKKRESVGKDVADLEKALQKTKGLYKNPICINNHIRGPPKTKGL